MLWIATVLNYEAESLVLIRNDSQQAPQASMTHHIVPAREPCRNSNMLWSRIDTINEPNLDLLFP